MCAVKKEVESPKALLKLLLSQALDVSQVSDVVFNCRFDVAVVRRDGMYHDGSFRCRKGRSPKAPMIMPVRYRMWLQAWRFRGALLLLVLSVVAQSAGRSYISQ